MVEPRQAGRAWYKKDSQGLLQCDRKTLGLVGVGRGGGDPVTAVEKKA
jgi:hypothetical protein